MIPAEWKAKAPRLAAIAKWLNEHTTLLAETEQGFCNTDRKIGRLRIPGKGRTGTRIKVWQGDEHKTEMVKMPFHYMYPDRYKDQRKFQIGPLLDHNAAETYRSNDEVVRWVERYLDEHPEALKPSARLQKGDIVRTWWSGGHPSGHGWTYGVITRSGEKSFSVTWESLVRNWFPHGFKGVEGLRSDDEREEAEKALKRAGLV